MVRLTLRLLFVGLIATQLAGCTTVQSWRSSGSKSKYSAHTKSKPQGSVDSDADEDEEDEDEDASKTAGGDRHGELLLDEPPDPWFGKYNYADKGRAIERSLR